MEITYCIDNNTLNIMLIGELDEHASAMTKRQLDAIIAQSICNCIIFDLSRLSFMDSTGIGVLLGRYKIATNRQLRVYIDNPSRTVDKILAMSGIYTIMPKVNASTRRT